MKQREFRRRWLAGIISLSLTGMHLTTGGLQVVYAENLMTDELVMEEMVMQEDLLEEDMTLVEEPGVPQLSGEETALEEEEAFGGEAETVETEEECGGLFYDPGAEMEYAFETIEMYDSQVYQLDNEWHTYAFVTPESGFYTFYSNQDIKDYEASYYLKFFNNLDDLTNGAFALYECSPSSITRELMAGETYYISVLGISKEQNSAELAVRRSVEAPVTLEDIVLVTDPNEVVAGSRVELKMKFDRGNMRWAEIKTTGEGAEIPGITSRALAEEDDNGYYSFWIDGTFIYEGLNQISISVFDEYGDKYDVVTEGCTAFEKLQICASTLQSKLDELAGAGGGTLDLGKRFGDDMMTDLIIPENVCLKAEKACISEEHGKITVKGKLQVKTLQIYGGYQIERLDNQGIVVVEREVCFDEGSTEQIMQELQQKSIQGCYGAYAGIWYEAPQLVQWRKGAWRKGLKSDISSMEDLPDEEEYWLPEDTSFEITLSSDDLKGDEFWVCVRPPEVDGGLNLKLTTETGTAQVQLFRQRLNQLEMLKEYTWENDTSLEAELQSGDICYIRIIADHAGPKIHAAGEVKLVSEEYPLKDEDVSLSANRYFYDGTEKKPAVIVTGLKEGTDYTVSYSDNINVGNATVTVTGKGKYTGTITRNFAIDARSLEDMPLVLSDDSYSYDGTAKKPAVNITGLKEGTDYTVIYSNNTNAGTASVTVLGKGNYTGSRKVNFTITGASISSKKIKLSATSYKYDGKSKKPIVTISGLKENTDYTVAFKNNKKPGTAMVTVTGKGNYKGTLQASFAIKIPVKSTYTAGGFKVKVTKSALNGSGTVTITAGTNKNITNISIPATVSIGGVKFSVTEIGSGAFKSYGKARSVSIGANVTKIGSSAFASCKSVKTLTINSKKLNSVGSSALKGIYKKCKIKVPSSKLKAYRKLLKGKGQATTVTISK